jgi:hypothetical protein
VLERWAPSKRADWSSKAQERMSPAAEKNQSAAEHWKEALLALKPQARSSMSPAVVA